MREKIVLKTKTLYLKKKKKQIKKINMNGKTALENKGYSVQILTQESSTWVT